MKKWNKEKHERIYIGLCVTIFALVGIFHATRLIRGWNISVGTVSLPYTLSVLATVLIILMLIMGGYYIGSD